LSNGIKIISRDNGSAVVKVQFSILSGSRAEDISSKGAAQLLASSAFAGTGKRSGLRLVRDIDNLGAKISACADREKIVFEVTTLADKTEAAFAAVSEAIVSAPPAYVVDEAKSTAQISYDNLASSPEMQLMELLHEAAFGENTPLGSSFFATNLDRLTSGDVTAFRAKNFTSGQMVVTTTGGLSHDALKQLAEVHLHGLPSSKPMTAAASPYVGGDMRVRTDLDGESHLALAFPVPAGDAAGPYKVLFQLLSSRLATQKPVSGSISPFFTQYSSGGLIGFRTSGSAAAASANLHAAVAAFKAAAGGGADVTSAARRVALEDTLAAESGSARGSSGLGSVTPGSVSSAGTDALKSTPSYAVLGTTFGTPSFAAISRLLL